MLNRKLLIAIIIVIVLLIIWWAFSTCRLGKYSSKKCAAKSNFCGECGDTPAPGALAEYLGLRQMSWRPDHFAGGRANCGPPRSSAIAEAQSLQRAGALGRQAPYYTKSTFSGSSCGNFSAEAMSEASILSDLQAIPSGGEMSAHKMRRDNAAFGSVRARRDALRSSPTFVSSHQARMDSVRENFGGPGGTTYGWYPGENGPISGPATGGWGNAAKLTTGRCYLECTDNCNGSACRDYCETKCKNDTAQAAHGVY